MVITTIIKITLTHFALFMLTSLYMNGSFLKMYMNSCYYTGKTKKAKTLLKELKDIINISPQQFYKADIEKIKQK